MRGRPSLRRLYAGLYGRAPWWVALAGGTVAVALGAAIIARPFTSLGVLVALVAAALVLTGVLEAASAGPGRPRVWLAAGWIAAGVAVALWPEATVRSLAVIVGVALLAGGLMAIVAARRDEPAERLIGVLGGLARAVLGGLALAWPDVTLAAVGLLVGPAIALFGVGQIASALRRRHGDGGAPRTGVPRRHRRLRLAGASVALLAVLGLLAASALVRRSSTAPDDFYAPPDGAPATPGVLLRSEPFTRGVPEGARAWRILYTTTRDDATPAVASGLVLAGEDAPPGPRPVIAWAHGTTGFDESCAPSLLPDPFGGTPALPDVTARGWVLVATDYTGLGTTGPHPYLIGDPTARSVLDAVRAARQLEGVELEPRTVVWGHSQGGGAALWTGALAPGYAPDAGVIGVAALSPAAALVPLIASRKDGLIGRVLGSYVLAAYEATYPDVRLDDYVRPAARILARATAGRCLPGPGTVVSVATAAGRETWLSSDPAAGPLGARLAENTPAGPIPAPLMIAQGLDDPLIGAPEQRVYVDGLCAAGQPVEYRTYAGRGHVDIVADPDSPLARDLVAWTEDRLAGRPPPPGCVTVAG